MVQSHENALVEIIGNIILEIIENRKTRLIQFHLVEFELKIGCNCFFFTESHFRRY